MSLFKRRVSSYLGVDLGTGSIKFVELENVGGRPRLLTYGMAEIETNVSREEGGESQEKIATILKKLTAKAATRSDEVIAALPNFSVFSSVISLPALSGKEMAQAISWEAKKFVPMPIANVVLDWKIIGQTNGKAEKNKEEKKENNQSQSAKNKNSQAMERILLTAAPKTLVTRYINIFKLAGLDLLSLETESFALARALVGNDPATVLIADIGSLTTDLTVAEGGIPVLARSIDVGGKTVTSAIANSMGIDEGRAEQFKRDVGLGEASEGVGQVVSQSFNSVINEMKYSLNLQKDKGSGRVEKILLTGGSAFLPGITDYLSKQLGIKAYVSKPWARISYPKDLSEILDTLSPRMAVAVGLAMREIE